MKISPEDETANCIAERPSWSQFIHHPVCTGAPDNIANISWRYAVTWIVMVMG